MPSRRSWTLLFPLATVVTPNLLEAEALAGRSGTERELAEAIVRARRSRRASSPVATATRRSTALFDGHEHTPIPVARRGGDATHGAGCTHSATLAALLAQGAALAEAARGAAETAAQAVAHGLDELGAGEGPVDVFGLASREAVWP